MGTMMGAKVYKFGEAGGCTGECVRVCVCVCVWVWVWVTEGEDG